MPNWSSGKYKVVRVGHDNSLLDHATKRKVFLRHEIRKQILYSRKQYIRYTKIESGT